MGRVPAAAVAASCGHCKKFPAVLQKVPGHVKIEQERRHLLTGASGGVFAAASTIVERPAEAYLQASSIWNCETFVWTFVSRNSERRRGIGRRRRSKPPANAGAT
jgi:hypothetical protein